MENKRKTVNQLITAMSVIVRNGKLDKTVARMSKQFSIKIHHIPYVCINSFASPSSIQNLSGDTACCGASVSIRKFYSPLATSINFQYCFLSTESFVVFVFFSFFSVLLYIFVLYFRPHRRNEDNVTITEIRTHTNFSTFK